MLEEAKLHLKDSLWPDPKSVEDFEERTMIHLQRFLLGFTGFLTLWLIVGNAPWTALVICAAVAFRAWKVRKHG